ncbi:NAD(P)H-hydrate epimerase [Rhodobacter lacus]|uniref:NAD(P)H-hydrate epimerase n=1 Tax=Rhodobacter lacus TaxID=1641972 RepID=A0ABW5AB34_9RHOB
MPQIVTTAQMRAIEQTAIASGAVTGFALMERAGAGAVEAICETWPDLATAPGKAVVICGPGNNGGDGYVVARLLKARGWRVDVFRFGTSSAWRPDAERARELWCAEGKAHSLRTLARVLRHARAPRYTLLVDAGFGIGLSTPLPDPLRDMFWAQQRGILAERVVALDVPSGLDADTGAVAPPPGLPMGPWHWRQGTACKADLTVTFHAAKPGHLTGQGPTLCGKLVVKSIGL